MVARADAAAGQVRDVTVGLDAKGFLFVFQLPQIASQDPIWFTRFSGRPHVPCSRRSKSFADVFGGFRQALPVKIAGVGG